MEEKSCGNCYWKYVGSHFSNGEWCTRNKKQPKENFCSKHNFKCECGDIAIYKYKDEKYCMDCILKELGVEECTMKYYRIDGECIGDENNIFDVIEDLDDDIESIKD